FVEGQLADGDEVEVSGVWDGSTIDADTIVNRSAGARPKRPRSRDRAKPPRDSAPKGTRVRIALVALAGVIVLTAAAALFFTDGFGVWTRPGPTVKPVS